MPDKFNLAGMAFGIQKAIVLSGIVCWLFASCTEAPVERKTDSLIPPAGSPAPKTETIDLRDSISLSPSVFDTSVVGYFSEFPPEIDGCSVIYSTDLNHYDARRYIYMNNYDSVSFMKINGQIVRFTLLNSEQREQDTRVMHFINDQYTLTIEETNGGRIGDEVWANYGTITLTDNTGKVTRIRFVGESGC